MSRVQTPTSTSNPRTQLQRDVRPAARRGRLFASLTVAMLCLAGLIGGFFLIALKDALFVLPWGIRLAFMLLLVLGSLGVLGVLALRPWLNQQYDRSAGERIDETAGSRQQPVTIGLSLKEPIDDDSLALMLLHRAERRASGVVNETKPSKTYPLRQLRGPTIWFANALGLWLLLAITLPAQVMGSISRVLLPWVDTPPFSLTQLEPQWQYIMSTSGPWFIELTVQPEGRIPQSVDWVVLDKAGDEVERFAMKSGRDDTFSYNLHWVNEPVVFRLEAFGRHTRTYTIEPFTDPTVAEAELQETADKAVDETEGTTQFDPDKIARRDLDAHRDWPKIKADLQKLLDALGKARATAEELDPADLEGLQALADQFDELIKEAEAIAGELAAIRAELPAQAAQLLDALNAALTNMRSAALPAPPSSSNGSPSSGEPTPSQWLDRAADAAEADKKQIGLGVGPSELPTGSGIASGNPEESLDIRDPNATGTNRTTIISDNDGPIPEAVMRQIPPSYRDHVSAYFERLAEE